MSDFYHPGTNEYLTRVDFGEKFNIILTEETYTEFRYIFQLAQRNLGITENTLISTFLPLQPLLIDIVNQIKKGCN